jgi:exonuclease III
MNKRVKIQAVIDTHQPAVLGITEVKPKTNRFTIEECEIAYKGYEMFHNLGKEGRGIALYVKSDLKPSVCEALDSDFAESVCRVPSFWRRTASHWFNL